MNSSPDSPASPAPLPDPEQDIRVGVYVCRCGGNISDVIDVEQVAEIARHIPHVATAKVHTFMCSDPGQLEIQEDIHLAQLAEDREKSWNKDTKSS